MRRISCVLSAALGLAAAGCGSEAETMQPAESRGAQAAAPQFEYARLTASLGGIRDRGAAINERGMVAGFSLLDTTRHAALWLGNSIVDLRTLGGAGSTVPWPGLNDRGMVVGISHTAETDTLGESWSCNAFLPNPHDQVCRGFFWDRGTMTAMPTFGGDRSFATGVNNRAQVVGWAETAVLDPTCHPTDGDQKLQFVAALWEPKRGRMTQLRPYPGDSASAATAINDRGQAVGISGDCDVAVGRFSARRAVLWERGQVRQIPDLGGEGWHTPMDVNEAGDVVGFSNPEGVTGGALVPHGFLWSTSDPDAIVDIAPLPGDDNSQAFAVNERRQVVGVSCKGGICRAFLWENGALYDLQDLVDLPETDSILSARDIDDAGRVTGDVRDRSTGVTHAYVATPVGAAAANQ
jgi:probable HAF family extracellular repeat protein